MSQATLVVRIAAIVPAGHITQLEMFLRAMDEAGVKWVATMDSHPSDADLAALPERLREAFVLQKGAIE